MVVYVTSPPPDGPTNVPWFTDGDGPKFGPGLTFELGKGLDTEIGLTVLTGGM